MSITEMAADELEAWELVAMRDPRNWVRPAAAVVVRRRGGHRLWCCCGPAGARRRTRPTCSVRPLELAERTLRDVAERDAPAARPAALSEPAGAPVRGAALGPQLGLPATPHGHLLSPSLSRDGRLLLQLRAPDLPRLHDHAPRSGCAARSAPRQRTKVVPHARQASTADPSSPTR